MAKFEYRFPELGEGLHEGEIVKMHIKPGDTVTDEDIIMEVQNDKAIVEVPCPVNGKVLEVLVKDGQVCHVGDIVAVIDAEGEVPEQAAPAGGSDSAPAPAAEAPESRSGCSTCSGSAKGGSACGSPAAAPAAPTAARTRSGNAERAQILARERRGYHRGSGHGQERPHHPRRYHGVCFGRRRSCAPACAKRRQAAPAAATKSAPAASAPYGDRAEERVPFKGIRKVDRERDGQIGLHGAARDDHGRSGRYCSLSNSATKAKPLAEKKGVKLTYLPFIVKALVAACREFPIMNSMLDEEKQEIVYKKYYNIGIATDTDNGLVVPVIRMRIARISG